MGDEKKGPSIHTDGIHLGDWVVRPDPTTSTDDHLDTPSSRERERRKEADLRPGEVEVSPDPRDAAAEVDASIAAARAAVAAREAAMPILLRDPLTGKVIGEE